jgi:hypothetical protein
MAERRDGSRGTPPSGRCAGAIQQGVRRRHFIPRLVPSYAFAEIYAGLRDKSQTLDALEKSYEERAWFLSCLYTAPEFHFILSEPRFQTLLRRMNFPH